MREKVETGEDAKRAPAAQASPYAGLPNRAFWRPAVADVDLFEIADLWTPKFTIDPDDPVVTYGSCFAQQIGRSLQARGFNWLRTERPPFGLAEENLKRFYYDVFSSRTGNIYTTSLLRQWVSWASRAKTPPDEVWQMADRFYDPFRPVVEPSGFASAEEVMASRAVTIEAFRKSVTDAKLLVFTLGLTEHWVNVERDVEYPMCPGTAAGTFSPERHQFRNHDYLATREHLEAAISAMRDLNPALRVLLTVSPVPMTATYSGQHVVVATMQTKSILRAVAGDLAAGDESIDYFPGYEFVNSPAFRGVFFGPNQRNVSRQGVAFVMDQFAACFGRPPHTTARPNHKPTAGSAPRKPSAPIRSGDDVCEEELLNAFRAQR